jgi:hypothetical protein
MQLSRILRTTVSAGMVLAAALCLGAQEASTPAKDARPKDTQGLPPRLSPSDYQSQTQAGSVTIAADFARHSVPTPQGALSTEDFVVVELGLYGPPEARLQISMDDFSLRINGKKTSLHTQGFVLVLSSLKDPEWSPPEEVKTKSKTGISTGGQSDAASPPPVVHVPIEVQHAMAQRIQKASLALGDRVLPQAGLLFFPYRGKADKLTSVELNYSGPAGNAILALRP